MRHLSAMAAAALWLGSCGGSLSYYEPADGDPDDTGIAEGDTANLGDITTLLDPSVVDEIKSGALVEVKS